MRGDGIGNFLGVGGCGAVCDGRSTRNDGVKLRRSSRSASRSIRIHVDMSVGYCINSRV